MKKAVVLFAMAFAALQASAEERPVTCTLRFAVHIDSAVLFTHGYGNAVAWCNNADGSIASQRNMSVEIEGLGPGLGVFDLRGTSQDLGLTHARQFQGTYNVADGNVGIVGLLGTPYYFEGYTARPSFYVGITAASGVGFRLNGSRWTFRIVR